MRPWHLTRSFVLPAAVLGLVVGCGGGGSGVSSSSTRRKNNPPHVTGFFVDHRTAPASLLQYKSYTLTAVATDPDIGDSIASYQWQFADGVTRTSVPPASADFPWAFTTSGTQNFQVRAVDSAGAASEWASYSVTVDQAEVPIVVTITSPTAASTLLVDLGGHIDAVYNIHVESTSAAAILPSGIIFDPNDSGGTYSTPVDNGGGNFTITAHYSAAATPGSRTVKPTILVRDVQGVTSDLIQAPDLTLNTVSATNRAPSLLVNVPASPTTTGFTTKPMDLGFVVSDPDGDAVTYTVDWGDGTPVSTATTSGDTARGVAVALTHAYADSFTTSSLAATVRVNATDKRSSNNAAVEQTRIFNIQYNSFPVATITSPQASAKLPENSELSGGVPTGYVNPAGPNDADIVVIPNGGKLHFQGAATPPGSGEAAFTYAWTFPSGVPMTASTADAGEVTFIVPNGTVTPVLVEFKVTDAFGRFSSNSAAASSKTYRKWVVVDGVNMQTFQLSYMFRQKSDTNEVIPLAYAKTEKNGYGSSVQVFQDGVNYTYQIRNSSGQAVVSLPVRSNLPFFARLSAFGDDTRNYLLRVPNAPSGPFSDPGLGTILNPAQTSFGFQNSTAPYNPTLQIVTGEGFAAETNSAPEKRIQGGAGSGMTLGQTPTNMRYVDRLSVPLLPSDPLGAIQWLQSSTNTAGFQNLRANQSFGEWVALWLNVDPKEGLSSESPLDTESSTAGAATDFGFVIDYPTFTSDSAKSKTFAQTRLEAFWVPPGSTDPYDLDKAGWDSPATITELNPTQISSTIAPFYDNLIWGGIGSAPLAGGIQNFPVPYDANDPDRIPYSPRTYSAQPIRTVFSYAEYLWSSVWARPAVLNRAHLSWQDTHFALNSYGFFRNAQPTAWPAKSGITPGISAFNMNVTGGQGADLSKAPFNPTSSPVGVGGTAPDATGVGRFYWTAYTPFYDISGGAVISRTWLSTQAGLPPTTFNGAAGDATTVGDATAAFGFLQPQDVVVDKRGRNANGTLNGQGLGGYRVTWFNPTKDTLGNCVPPDFWVVEVNTSGAIQDFLIPSNYPAPPNAQSVGDLILTDARTYLPSGLPAGGDPAPGNKDLVAPGYCWFDLPSELRPNVLFPSQSSTITVFALKSILKNHPPVGFRTLTPADWIDAVKTVTANVKVNFFSDLSFAHKIPFNYYWDIVVVNGPATYVAP